MQVPVTVTHEAIVESLQEHAVEFVELLLGPVLQESELIVADDVFKVIEVFANEVLRLLNQPLAIALLGKHSLRGLAFSADDSGHRSQ